MSIYEQGFYDGYNRKIKRINDPAYLKGYTDGENYLFELCTYDYV